MRVRDMFERVLVESGQFLMRVENIELDVDKFVHLVRSSLSVYNGFHPIDEKFNLSIETSYDYTFTSSFEIDGTTYGIPDWIVQLTPIRIVGVLPYQLRDTIYREHAAELEKSFYPFRYQKPVLYIPVSGVYEIHAAWEHKLVEEEVTGVDDNKEIIWSVETLNDTDDDFLDLVRAKFMQALGRSRRAFTLEGLPITLDASELISEGEALEEKIMEGFREETMKFWLAWGG